MLRDQACVVNNQPKASSQLFQVPESIQSAIDHHQAGRLAEAEAIYRQVLATDPSNFDALHLLGVIARQVGNLQQAINLIGQAIQQNPSNPFAHFNLGNAFKDQGSLDEAITSYHQALAFKPDYADALINQGIAFDRQDKLDQATSCFRKALTLNPGHIEARNNLGLVFKKQGKLAEALSSFLQVLSLKPDFAETHNNLGNAYKDSGRLDEAQGCFRQALSLKPDFAEAHYNLGLLFKEQGKLNEASACYRHAILLNPGYAEAHNNLGVVFKEQGKLDEAMACYQHVVSLNPDYVEAYNNLGVVLKERGQMDDALINFQQAISLEPNAAKAHYNLSLLLLQMGNLRKGWEEYEYRWHNDIAQIPQRSYPRPWWQGEDLQGKTILVWGEQGLGDELRYASFIPELSRLAKHCVFECEPRLTSLFSRSFPTAEVIPKSNPPHPRTTGTDIAVQSPAASLARWLRPHLESFPQHNGYLVADPERIAYWQMRINALGTGLKVGISWRSSLMTSGRNRSHTQIEQWGAIFRVPGVVFVNLQYGECHKELEQAKQLFGIRIHHWDGLDLKNDLEDVAGLTVALDMVISSASSVSDFAGALGKPVWMMDMRYVHWDDLGQNFTPWYPNMRLFYRDWNEDWTRVIDTVAQELRQLSGTNLPHSDL